MLSHLDEALSAIYSACVGIKLHTRVGILCVVCVCVWSVCGVCVVCVWCVCVCVSVVCGVCGVLCVVCVCACGVCVVCVVCVCVWYVWCVCVWCMCGVCMYACAQTQHLRTRCARDLLTGRLYQVKTTNTKHNTQHHIPTYLPNTHSTILCFNCMLTNHARTLGKGLTFDCLQVLCTCTTRL